MPYSFTYFKQEVKEWFVDNIPTTKRILDVGPGLGTYSDLIRDCNYKMDAIEIFNPYISKYNLREKYDNVYLGDILEFSISNYDFIILGDILEHLTPEDGVGLIDDIVSQGKECLVAVPYIMEQGEHEGNIHETHLQPDLTHEIMSERYPDLKVIYRNEYYGYYVYSRPKVEKAYVLYATKSYLETVSACVKSLNEFSDIPVFVYLLNFDADIKGATTINYECDIIEEELRPFIDRFNSNTYKILILRPEIVKHCILNFADTVVYVDSDSVATLNVDRIFSMVPEKSWHPYFVEGLYDWLQYNDRGDVMTKDDYHKSLEYPACELFNVDQHVRKTYRQSGYFVASKWNIAFLDEWSWMCNHPFIKQNTQLYAPYNEETILNVLLWKYNIQVGLPFLYVNGSLPRVREIYLNNNTNSSTWHRVPSSKENILFFHGEKSPITMSYMINEIREYESVKRILFLAPHLSTGGMPAFLLKRIQALSRSSNYKITVVEYQNYSDEYVVQKQAIIDLIGQKNFFTISGDKFEMLNIIEQTNPEVIHIDEMSERLEYDFAKELYKKERSYKIVETCHDITFEPREKIFTPDSYAFCTPYHLETFIDNPGSKVVIEYPIEEKIVSIFSKLRAKRRLGFPLFRKNVVNIGLWTPGKNQAEGIEIAKLFPEVVFHFVGNQAGNFQEYWEPLMQNLPDNVKVWGERNDISTFLKAADVFMFNSTFECNPIVLREAVGYHLPILARNLPQYIDMFSDYITDLDINIVDHQLKKLLYDADGYKIREGNTLLDFEERHSFLYDQVIQSSSYENEIKDYHITNHFVGQPFLEITGTSTSDFRVQYIVDNIVVYENSIKINSWVRLNCEYYKDYRIRVLKDSELIYDEKINLKDKRVYIAFDSESLGDTIAWVPYLLEFQKKHSCKLIVSTFKNYLFEKVYPEFEWVLPGTNVSNLYAMYKIGWFYDDNKEPVLPNTIPLQQTATNILGLDYVEIKPRIYHNNSDNIWGKHVAIATNSTSGCKFWTREGWQEVINYLSDKGYRVINTSLEENHFDNCQVLKDKSMESTINCINTSEFFIGLSSGLSWLAWALDREVIMIANFTNEEHEFSCYKLTNLDVSNSCWNSSEFKFDKGDWDWCPRHKGTDRQFECQKSITGKQVIEKVITLISELG